MRGLARTAGHWGDFVDRLRRHHPDDAVEAVDLPGFGTSREPTPASIAATVMSLRERLGDRGEEVWLLGLSMGGMVAYEWARRYPEQVAGVVLVNSSAGGFSRPWRRMRPAALLQVVAAFFTRDPRARERRLFALTSRRPGLSAAIVDRWVALAAEAPVRRLAVVRQLFAAATFRPRAPEVFPPCLILNGRQDALVHPSCSRALAHVIPGAIFSEHPSAGHDLPLDDPDWVIGQLSSWLPRRDRTKLLQI